ncbi:MAG: ThiF family adenylyltransferase [Pirellulaceae bacterium]|nr:ThiF family adenylyltransferase [Planctomycetales bacterium]
MLTNRCEIIVDRPAYQRALRGVIVDPGRCSVGRVRYRETNSGLELIIDDWQAPGSLPNAQLLPPLHSLAVLTSSLDPRINAESLSELLQLERSQLLVGFVLDPHDHSKLDVVVIHQGDRLCPTKIRFIGAGIFNVAAEKLTGSGQPPAGNGNGVGNKDGINATREFHSHRRSRTEGALGRQLYERFASMRLLVIGAGGGGSELARQLCSLNPAWIVTMDGDQVGPENLNALPHASEQDAWDRIPKVHALARVIHANQPDLRLSTVQRSIQQQAGADVLMKQRFDAVFTFIDNDAGRLVASWLCGRHHSHTVHVDVGTLIQFTLGGRRIMRADIRLFEPGRGCVACVPKMANLSRVMDTIAAPRGAMRRGKPRQWNASRAGSLLSLNAMAASLATDLFLSYLDGRIATSHWLRVRWPFGKLPLIRSHNVTGDPECRFCGHSR